MVFSKDRDELITALAVRNRMDMDRIISCYLVAGDDLFVLLRILEGQTVTVPSKRRLNCASLHNIRFIEDDDGKYGDVVKGDWINFNGEDYVAVSGEKKVLNHCYLPVAKEDEDDEQ